MIDTTLSALKDQFAGFSVAIDYFQKNYEEIANRPCAYRLYGAYEIDGIGPLRPRPLKGTVFPRKLSTKYTRRKNYTIYELDKSYKVLRIIHMLDYNALDCVYHFFDLGEYTYAYPVFPHWSNKVYPIEIPYWDAYTEICAQKYKNGHPFATLVCNMSRLITEYYEYISDSEIDLTTYWYYPTKKTMYGIKTNGYEEVIEDAPFESVHSPVVVGNCIEKRTYDYDFSKYFQ